MRQRRAFVRPSRTILWAVLAVCAFVLAGAPLVAHRDDCHVKLRTDCGACIAGATTASLDAGQQLGPNSLPFVETLETIAQETAHVATPSPIAGRAPPA